MSQVKSPVESPEPPTACVFAPSPLLTITVERPTGPDEDRGGDGEVHLHPGGQGYWISRMLSALGVDVRLCASFAGETGAVLRSLVDAESVTVHPVQAAGTNGAYVHDRRSGERREVAVMAASTLSRHEVDGLYEATIAAALEADVAVLGGPSASGILDPEVYRRLAGDLRRNGTTVVADLSGEPLAAALAGGLAVLKMSHEELIAEGRCGSADPDEVVAAMRALVEAGADAVVITRAAQTTLALVDGELLEVISPDLEALDPRGAGDSVTAGISAALARGDDLAAALELGGAAGALNVARRGLATGSGPAIESVADHVTVTHVGGIDTATQPRAQPSAHGQPRPRQP